MTSVADTVKAVLHLAGNWTSYGLSQSEPADIYLITELARNPQDRNVLNSYKNIASIIIFRQNRVYEPRSHSHDTEIIYMDVRISSTSADNVELLTDAVRNILIKAGVTGFDRVYTRDRSDDIDNLAKRWVTWFRLYLERTVDNC